MFLVNEREVSLVVNQWLGSDKEIVMDKAAVKRSLNRTLEIDGCLGSAIVDFESGMCLGTTGNPGFDLELAAAGNTEVVRAKKRIRDKLGLADKIEDILISLDSQYQPDPYDRDHHVRLRCAPAQQSEPGLGAS